MFGSKKIRSRLFLDMEFRGAVPNTLLVAAIPADVDYVNY